jgi:hypothetical protein
MKMTPIVGEMNARLIAIALGRPMAFLLSRSPAGTGIAVAIRVFLRVSNIMLEILRVG